MNTSNSTIVVKINNKSLNMKLANEFNISIIYNSSSKESQTTLRFLL